MSSRDAGDADAIDWPVEVNVDESYELDPKENSIRTQRVKDAYGIDFQVGELVVIDDVTVSIDRGDVVFATGASGAGKTTFCEAVADELDAVQFAEVDVPRDTTVVDLFPDEMDTTETQRYMAMFGLGEAYLNLRTFEELSQGQKYRTKLAYTASQYDVVFADEYCATLDRETARTISYSIRRQLNKGNLATTFIFATTHRDVIADLRPDLLLDFDDNHVKLRRSDVDVDDLDDADAEAYETGDVADVEYLPHGKINREIPETPSKDGRTSFGALDEFKTDDGE